MNIRKNKFLYISILLLFSYTFLSVKDYLENNKEVEYDEFEDGSIMGKESLVAEESENTEDYIIESVENTDEGVTKEKVEAQNNSIRIKEKKVVSISIPKKGIEKEIIAVGLNKKGEIYVPDNPKDIVWYEKYGEDIKNILIAGHRTWGKKKGLFYGSEHWEKGLEIEVKFEDGSLEIFELKNKYRFKPESTPMEIMSVKDGDYRVTLITCSSDGSERIYNLFYLKKED